MWPQNIVVSHENKNYANFTSQHFLNSEWSKLLIAWCLVFSQWHFPKGNFLSGNFPSVNFPKVRLDLLNAAGYNGWPNAAARMSWGPSAAARTGLWPSAVAWKVPAWELARLGTLGKTPRNVVTWGKVFGKVPYSVFLISGQQREYFEYFKLAAYCLVP